MPLYMDHHKNLERLAAEAVAEDWWCLWRWRWRSLDLA